VQIPKLKFDTKPIPSPSPNPNHNLNPNPMPKAYTLQTNDALDI